MGRPGFTCRFDIAWKEKGTKITGRRKWWERWERNKRLGLFLDVFQPFRNEHVGLVDVV